MICFELLEIVLKKKYQPWSFEELFWNEISGIDWKQIGMVFLLALIVFLPGIIRIIKKKSTFKEVFLAYWIFVWGGIMLLITILRREPGYATEEVNPFPTWENFGGSDFVTAFSIFNVLLFIPWGFFLRLYNHKKAGWKAFLITMLVGLVTTCTIEVTQLVTKTGYFEFTDMINNVLGCFIGSCFGASLIKKLRKSAEKTGDNP